MLTWVLWCNIQKIQGLHLKSSHWFLFSNFEDSQWPFAFLLISMSLSIAMRIPTAISVRFVSAAASVIPLLSIPVATAGLSAVPVPLPVSFASSLPVTLSQPLSFAIAFSVPILTIFVGSAKKHVRTEVWHWLFRLRGSIYARYRQDSSFFLSILLSKSANVQQRELSK